MSVSFYLAALDLRGRPVLLAGAGRVGTRRLARLLDAGAAVHVVAPSASEVVAELARQGRVRWSARAVAASDLDGVWYALACTNDADANALVAAEAEARRVFCVRADRADGGTARTPAVGVAGEVLVGVIGDRTPRASAAARDVAVAAITASTLDAVNAGHR